MHCPNKVGIHLNRTFGKLREALSMCLLPPGASDTPFGHDIWETENELRYMLSECLVSSLRDDVDDVMLNDAVQEAAL